MQAFGQPCRDELEPKRLETVRRRLVDTPTQARNARLLTEGGGAEMISDRELTPENLGEALGRIFQRLNRQDLYPGFPGRDDAAERLAELIISLGHD